MTFQTGDGVCSLGVRVLTRLSKEQNERLVIKSLADDLRAQARVVYCQRLADGRFAVGISFVGAAFDWSKGSKIVAGDWEMPWRSLRGAQDPALCY